MLPIYIYISIPVTVLLIANPFSRLIPQIKSTNGQQWISLQIKQKQNKKKYLLGVSTTHEPLAGGLHIYVFISIRLFCVWATHRGHKKKRKRNPNRINYNVNWEIYFCMIFFSEQKNKYYWSNALLVYIY